MAKTDEAPKRNRHVVVALNQLNQQLAKIDAKLAVLNPEREGILAAIAALEGKSEE